VIVSVKKLNLFRFCNLLSKHDFICPAGDEIPFLIFSEKLPGSCNYCIAPQSIDAAASTNHKKFVFAGGGREKIGYRKISTLVTYVADIRIPLFTRISLMRQMNG
jgi:hypothetical protein